MDNRKKILLGNKDILSRTVKDFYIDVNLSKDNREIWQYKYDNVFDITYFYNKERRESREFIIYGAIDSYLCDCNDLIIKVYDNSQCIGQPIATTNSKELVSQYMPFKNLYGKRRGRYIVDNIPLGFSGFSIYMKVESQNSSINDIIQHNVYEQQIIFTTLTFSNSGEKIVEKLDYGLNEAVTDCDGNVFEVNNDFDFFYNKHWIKKNLNIINSNKIWIGDESTKYCATEVKKLYHDRIVVGIFNTGYFEFVKTMEVYEIDMSPTGNIEFNDASNIEHYQPPIYNDGMCPIPKEFSLKIEILFSPADGNNFFTAPTDNILLSVSPDDFIFDSNQPVRKYLETETVTVIIENNNPLWEFNDFYLNSQPQNLNSSLSVKMLQDTVVQIYYKEVCSWSLSINSTFLDYSGNVSISPTGETISYSVIKNKYYNNEPITISPTDNYYIESFIINGNNGTLTSVEDVADGTTKNIISFNITSNTILSFIYRKY